MSDAKHRKRTRGKTMGVLVVVRLQPDQLATVDRIRRDNMSRADVVRELITRTQIRCDDIRDQ